MLWHTLIVGGAVVGVVAVVILAIVGGFFVADMVRLARRPMGR